MVRWRMRRGRANGCRRKRSGRKQHAVGWWGRKYPWGDSIDFTKANYGEIGGITPVGSYAPNGYGLYDMAGNVWEWCLDVYDEDFYRVSPRENPLSRGDSDNIFASARQVRVLRGGGWVDGSVFMRVANRNRSTPTGSFSTNGFRCVRDQ